MLQILLCLALTGPATAHSPHTIVKTLMVDPDFDTSGMAWLIEDPHDISGLLISEDWARHWDFVGGAPQNDDIVDGGVAAGKLVLVSDDGVLWSSTAGADDWISQTLLSDDVKDMDLVDGRGAFATGDGLVLVDVDGASAGTMALEGEGLSATAFAVDDEALIVAGSPTGEVWRSTDAGADWESLTDLPGTRRVWSLASVDGAIYAGTSDGVMSWTDASAAWTLCEALPVTIAESHANDVPLVVAQADGRLLATTGEESMFVSDDGCLSWGLWDTSTNVSYGGVGDATSADQAYTGLYIGDGLAISAGYMGLTWSDDDGASWTRAKLLPEDYSRGVDFSPDFPEDPRLVFAGYGGAVALTPDGGASWTGSAVGISDAVSYDVALASDFPHSGVMYYIGSNDGYISEDEGQTFTRLTPPMDRVRRFIPIGRQVFALGEDSDGGVNGQLAWTRDLGVTWHEFAGLYDVSEGAAPRDLQQVSIDGVDTLLLVVDQPAGLLLSDDLGNTWRWVWLGENEPAAGAASWPPDTGGRLVFASASDGVILSDDGGSSWRSVSTPPEGTPRDFAVADDGTLFLVNRVGQMWRSTDGGDTWAAVGDPIIPAVYVLKTAPDFAATPLLVAGTQAGLFWSWDAGDNWHQLARYERFEAETYHLYCQALTPGEHSDEVNDGGDCTPYTDATHGLGGGVAPVVGDRLRFTFQGHAFQVDADGVGSFDVSVNGVAAGSLDIADAPAGLDDLGDDDWKDVELLVTATTDLRVDLVEVWGAGDVMAAPEDGGSGGGSSGGGSSGGGDDTAGDTGSGKEPDCGCASEGGGGGGAAWLLLAVGALSLRRRPS